MNRILFSKSPLSIRYLPLANEISRKIDVVASFTRHLLYWKSHWSYMIRVPPAPGWETKVLKHLALQLFYILYMKGHLNRNIQDTEEETCMRRRNINGYNGKGYEKRLHAADDPVSRWTGRMEDRKFWFVSKTGMTKQFTVFIVLIVLCILTRKVDENYQFCPYKRYIMIL